MVESYISYGLGAFGQALNTHLDKMIVILQKRALRLMYLQIINLIVCLYL